MATDKPRFTITVPDNVFDKIEDFRFENRYSSRSDAVIALIKLGLQSLKENKNTNE